MQYVYAVMWFIMAMMLIFKFSKENKIFYLAGALFLVFGFWWLFDALLPNVNLFAGMYGWIFKGIIAVVLVIIAIFYINYRKNNKEE